MLQEWNRRLRTIMGVFLKSTFFISDVRREQILFDIRMGSDPRHNYYLLLLLSALIATFGLLANSPAVVIGAMLVSPLMTPIFGIAIGLLTGDARLLRSALFAEAGGVALAVTAGALVGFSPLAVEVTPEVLSRTSPNLLDLLVAGLAGFAGCLAMIDERISPILPGIAMATSLTPPLAASGLCLAFGATDGGLGAFVLFLANFLAILFVSSFCFVLAGFVGGPDVQSKKVYVKRFALAAISLVVMTYVLTGALVSLIRDKHARETIRHAVLEELSSLPALSIREVLLDETDDGSRLLSLVVIDASREPMPGNLQRIEAQVNERLQRPADVLVKTHITRSVSSSGERLRNVYRSADGIEMIILPDEDLLLLNVATQVVRERIEHIPGMVLADSFMRRRGKWKDVHITLQGPLRPFPGGVAELQKRIRDVVQDRDVRLVVRYEESFELAADGGAPVDMSLCEGEESGTCQMELLASNILRMDLGLRPLAVKAREKGGDWVVVAEVAGERLMTPEQVRGMEQILGETVLGEVRLTVHTKVEAMVDSQSSMAGL